jgi:hypothetical protein
VSSIRLTLATGDYDQGVAHRPVAPDELFAPQVAKPFKV